MNMQLYDVLVSILVDAESEDDAKSKVRSFLVEAKFIDYNFIVHKAEFTGDKETLIDLRTRQTKI